MRTRLLSLALALALCLGLALPAFAAEENYFSKNGLKTAEEPPKDAVSFTFVNYDSGTERENAVYYVEQGKFYVESCTTVPAEQAGYQTTTLTVRAEMFICTDPETYAYLLGCGWRSRLYDYYTGQNLYQGDLSGDDTVEGVNEVTYGGKTYTLTCKESIRWEQGDWDYDTAANREVSSMTAYETIQVTAPVEYDGLVYALGNRTNAVSEERDADKIYYADGKDIAVYFRFGPKAASNPGWTPMEPETPTQASVPQTSNWAKEQVTAALNKGLRVDGLGSDYRVGITRGQFAAVAVKLYEVMSGEKVAPAASNPFTDTEDPEILRANALGLVEGMGEGKFAPDSPVTREQAATLLSRVYTKLGGEIPEVEATTFADDASVAKYARNAVAFMSEKGILTGVGDNQFQPKNGASIEQALIIALRMAENLK